MVPTIEILIPGASVESDSIEIFQDENRDITSRNNFFGSHLLVGSCENECPILLLRPGITPSGSGNTLQ
jgi:hypothetical protein